MTATKRRANLTEAEKSQIAALRETGLSCRRIAGIVGCSVGSVSWHCLSVGADTPKAKPLHASIKGPAVYQRNGKAVRRFTPADDALLTRLSIEGKTNTEIARALGRLPNSIRGRLMTLARHEARRENCKPKERAA